MTIDDLTCKVECQDVLTRLCTALDEGDGAAAWRSFADDVVLRAPDGRDLVGEDARAFLHARPATIATRHIMTNVLVTPDGPDEAAATASILVYRVPVQDRTALPRTLPATPQAVGDWRLRFRRTSAGWRIARYAADQILVPAN